MATNSTVAFRIDQRVYTRYEMSIPWECNDVAYAHAHAKIVKQMSAYNRTGGLTTPLLYTY